MGKKEGEEMMDCTYSFCNACYLFICFWSRFIIYFSCT